MDNNTTLTVEDFYKKYHPEYNTILVAQFNKENPDDHGTTSYNDLAPHNGCMYETYGKELDYVKNVPQGRVWTIIDNNDGWFGIVAGCHWVNRIGYLITEEEWSDSNEEYVISDEGPVNEWFFGLSIEVQKSLFPDLKMDPEHEEEYQLTDAWYELGLDEREVIMNNYIKN